MRGKEAGGGRTVSVEQVITSHARLARNAGRNDDDLCDTHLNKKIKEGHVQELCICCFAKDTVMGRKPNAQLKLRPDRSDPPI